jgi:hypothetical protein
MLLLLMSIKKSEGRVFYNNIIFVLSLITINQFKSYLGKALTHTCRSVYNALEI